MSIAVITPPEPLVSLELAKAHLRVDHADDDTLITAYIAAASAALDGPDGMLGCSLAPQTLELTLDGFWTGWRGAPIRLPCGPVTAIESVRYDAPASADLVLDPASYRFDAQSLRTAFAAGGWPAIRAGGDAVRVRYTAGYEALPPPIVVAALLSVQDLYDNRSASVIEVGKGSVLINPSAAALVASFKVRRV